MHIKTKKKVLYVETFACKANIQVDIVKEINNKVLIKTWCGFTELTLDEKEKCWIVTNESKKIPENWECFFTDL